MRAMILVGCLVVGGCATPDPAPRPRATQGLPAQAGTERGPATSTAEPSTTSDPGTRTLPLGPVGGLTVETPPPPPPNWTAPAAPNGSVEAGPVFAPPESAPPATWPPPSDAPAEGSGALGDPPTGALPPPVLR
ncbi:MAG: hypothetical protein ACYTG6_00020 [Planctomycetota bacterium]|jgi:hypothetical protein